LKKVLAFFHNPRYFCAANQHQHNMTTNFPITIKAAHAIGMTISEAINNERKASLLAGKKLRELGYVRKYSHLTWDKGMKWVSPDGNVYDTNNTTVLGYAVA